MQWLYVYEGRVSVCFCVWNYLDEQVDYVNQCVSVVVFVLVFVVVLVVCVELFIVDQVVEVYYVDKQYYW